MRFLRDIICRTARSRISSATAQLPQSELFVSYADTVTYRLHRCHVYSRGVHNKDVYRKRLFALGWRADFGANCVFCLHPSFRCQRCNAVGDCRALAAACRAGQERSYPIPLRKVRKPNIDFDARMRELCVTRNQDRTMIEIGARLPGTPLTPPYMRVRIRRFISWKQTCSLSFQGLLGLAC